MTDNTLTATPQTAGLYVQLSSVSDRQISDASADRSAPHSPVIFPLKHTDVKATVSGNISRVEVTQTFENPFTTPLEATYVFPLPDEAAVDMMTIRLGDRTIQGRIEKREEAQAIYEQAKQEGRTAGLLEQERANIFTQSLANIRPGEQIEVVITYSDSLPYKQGSYEFVFPMVVGPRYIPGHPIADAGVDHGSAPAPMTLNQDTDQVPDASRLNGPIVPAGTRSGHDIQVTVEIEMGNVGKRGGEVRGGDVSSGRVGMQLSNLHSPSHQIRVDTLEGLTRITLAPNDTLPNKDLILRYQVAGAETQSSVLTQVDQRGGHFAVYLIPSMAYDPQQYIPKDMVFLIDTSGSQSGLPLAQCQALMRRFIDGLHPQDSFNIINFANTTQQLSKVPLDTTPRNRQQALNYVNSLRAGGGTEMLRGLKTVLNLPQLTSDRIRNVVLLTDGYIGNETQIFAEVQRSLSTTTRLHCFGAGSSVNRFLLNRVAEFGRGISHVVRHDQPIDQVVDTFFSQINNPVLGNLSLRWGGEGEYPELYPMAPPDLFAEQPLVLFGRKRDRHPGVLHLTGIAGNGIPFEQSFRINFEVEGAENSGNVAIAQLWGRARIKELMNQMVSGETTQGVEAVTQTALNYQLLSQYTAFVAVSDEVRVEQPNEDLSMYVPVNMPDGMSYEGVFGALASPAQMERSASIAVSPMVSAAPPKMGSAKRAKSLRRSRTTNAHSSARSLSQPPAQPPSLASRLGGLFKKKANPKPDESFSPSKPKSSPEPQSVPIIESEESLELDDDMTLQADYEALSAKVAYASSSDEDLSEQRKDVTSDRSPVSHRIKIIEAEGLSGDAFRHLEQHLQTTLLEGAQSGLLVFDLVIKDGRVKRIMLDIEASASLDPGVVYQLRQALLTWPCPQLPLTSLRIKLQINA